MGGLRALAVASELFPLIKTGGLADVAGALPRALAGEGVETRTLLPGYPTVLEQLGASEPVHGYADLFGGPAQLLRASGGEGLDLLVLEAPHLYDRPGGPYQAPIGPDWPDNAQRFAALAWAARTIGLEGVAGWRPDVVHAHDWQAGLAPAYLALSGRPRPATVMTIHNLAFQGVFPPVTVSRLGLPPSSFSPEGVEYYGNMSFLKAGIHYADHVTTVSPNYAHEIQREPLGMGLQGLLAHRSASLTGILNGIDTDAWDPESDPYIAKYYNASRLPVKLENKRALQARLRLDPKDDIPLVGSVGRFTEQKGFNLILQCAPDLLKMPVQLAILGSGEAALQESYQGLARTHAGKVGVQIGYDESLAHQIEAGADIFLMPSRFEPCGLNQMYSQRYGTPPVVHATGGLVDSVVDTNPETIAAKSATGFLFSPMTRAALLSGVSRAVSAYRDKKLWRQLQKNGMGRDFSWEASAQRYVELYRSLLA
jgi:starch synthase